MSGIVSFILSLEHPCHRVVWCHHFQNRTIEIYHLMLQNTLYLLLPWRTSPPFDPWVFRIPPPSFAFWRGYWCSETSIAPENSVKRADRVLATRRVHEKERCFIKGGGLYETKTTHTPFRLQLLELQADARSAIFVPEICPLNNVTFFL